MLSKLGSRAAVAAATLALVVVSACSFKADIFLTKTFTGVTVNNGTYTRTQEIDLAAEAPGLWKRRDNLKSLDVVAVEATVIAIRAGAGVPVSGKIILTRGATEVEVGTYTHTLAASAPDSFSVTMPASGNALIMDAIDGDGKFGVKATATTTGNIDLDVKVTLHLGVNYEVKP